MIDTTDRGYVEIDSELCKGCGLCIITCKPNALTYKIVRPPEYLKPKPPEGQEEPQQSHAGKDDYHQGVRRFR